MANNFKAWVDSPTLGQEIQDFTTFNADTERVSGFKAGNPASAIRVNSALRQANLGVAGIMAMFDQLQALPSNLNLTSSIESVRDAARASLNAHGNIVLNNAKTYTDEQIDVIEEELASLEGSSSTLTQRVGTLESEMDAAQSAIEVLERTDEINIDAVDWTGSASPYSYSIPASVHRCSTVPTVIVSYNGNTVECKKQIASNGDITLYSNAKVAVSVRIR